MRNLYEITGGFLKLYELLEEGEIDEEVFADTIEGLEYELEEKADGYAKIIAMLNNDVSAIDAEIKRLTDRKKTFKNNIDYLKKNLEQSMIYTGKRKFKTSLFSFNIQKNPPKLVIDDPEKIPVRFYIEVEPKIDNAAIKEEIKNGEEFDWAHMEQTEGLRIR